MVQEKICHLVCPPYTQTTSSRKTKPVNHSFVIPHSHIQKERQKKIILDITLVEKCGRRSSALLVLPKEAYGLQKMYYFSCIVSKCGSVLG